MSDSDYSESSLQKKLSSIEKRLEKIEYQLGIEAQVSQNDVSNDFEETGNLPGTEIDSDQDKDSGYESKVVEYGLAWFGSFVLLFGVIFLVTYLRGLGYPIMASSLGYIAVVGVFFASYFLRKPFPHLVFVLNLSGYLLLYSITLRLHFFSANPLVPQMTPGLILLAIVIGTHLYFAIRNKSEFMAGIGIMMVLLTAIFADVTYITLTIIAIATVVSFFMFMRYGWWRLLLFSLFMIYLSHLFWLLGNPVMGHPVRIVSEHDNNLIFMFFYVLVFALTAIIPTKKTISEGSTIAITFWNALSFSAVLLLIVVRFYSENYVWIFELIAGASLLYSITLKYRIQSKFAPAFYACIGFMTLSVAVYGYVKLPDTYMYLALESLLVVSMALWFRSRLIVVVNAFLYIGILILYLSTSPSSDLTNFIFAAVALATARILNWKRERLTLKTDLLRNTYLFAAFIMILYGLNNAVPVQHVTLSWTVAAIIYFVLSIILKNTKYRWMAILTIFVSGIRLFLMDLENMGTGYRVIAFLFFAVISISLSIYYTKKIKERKS